MSDTRSPDYPDPKTRMDDGPAPELSPSEARQGVTGHKVRYVLAWGTLGAIIAVALAYVFFFAS